MGSYQALINRINTRVIDLPTAVQTEVPQLVNDAINFLTNLHNFSCMKTELTLLTVPAPTALPGTIKQHVIGQIPQVSATTYGWKEPRENPYYVQQIGSVRELDWAPAGNRVYTYRQWESPFDVFSKGPPRMLLISPSTDDPLAPDLTMVDANIEAYPYSDSLSDWTTAPVGEYRIHIPYWGYLPQLSQPGDTNWFVENGPQYIISMATSLAFELDWDEEHAMYWRTKALGKVFDESNLASMGGWGRVLVNLDKGIMYAPARVLTPRRDVFAPRDQWRT